MFTYSQTRVLLAATALHSVNTDASSGWGLGKSGKLKQCQKMLCNKHKQTCVRTELLTF